MFKLLDCDIKELTQNVAQLKRDGIEFALIYQYDSLSYCEIEELDINWNTLIEARLFGEEKEIHIIREAEGFKSIELCEEREAECLSATYLLQKSSGFSKMTIKKHIEYDDDGQAYIRYVRPSRLYRG